MTDIYLTISGIASSRVALTVQGGKVPSVRGYKPYNVAGTSVIFEIAFSGLTSLSGARGRHSR